MRALSIDKKRLLLICNFIRQLKTLPVKERRSLVDALLKEVGVLQADSERLLCVKHCKEARTYASHASVYRALMNAGVHRYSICCRDFFSKDEISRLPPKGELSSHLGKKRVRVKRTAKRSTSTTTT
jgi:hypothetical protein